MVILLAVRRLKIIPLGVAAAEVSLHAVLQAKWNNFKATHSKEYHHKEEPKRMQAFLRNTYEIEVHNERFAKGLESFHLGHNHFTDMTHEEFVNTVLMKTPRDPQEHAMNATTLAMPSTPMPGIPENLDWRSRTAGRVKNQGSCGSCYTFGSAGALESAYFRKTNRQIDLSEQHLLDCSSGRTYGNSGCNGGLEGKVFEFVKKNGGVHLSSDYPYQAKVGTCQTRGQKHAAVASYVHLDNEVAITNGLASVGPMAAGICASARKFYMYSGGVFDDAQCGTNLDHSVVLVGYGTANGIKYYTIKNSWGESWGEKGYMRLNRNHCAINRDGIYPILS
jgi:cathepsin L